MGQPQRCRERFNPLLPGRIGGGLIKIVHGTPWALQRDRNAEFCARLVVKGDDIAAVVRDGGSRGDTGQVALVPFQECRWGGMKVLGLKFYPSSAA